MPRKAKVEPPPLEDHEFEPVTARPAMRGPKHSFSVTQVGHLWNEGMTHKEIAGALDITEAQSRAKLYRFRRRARVLPVSSMKPLHDNYQVMTNRARRIDREKFALVLEDRMAAIIGSIDDHSIKKATLQQRINAFSHLFDKTRLLRDEPTQIHSSQDLASMNELAQALSTEMKRRGLSLDDEPVIVEGETV